MKGVQAVEHSAVQGSVSAATSDLEARGQEARGQEALELEAEGTRVLAFAPTKRPVKVQLPKNRRWHTWLNVFDAETGEPLTDVTLVTAGRSPILVTENRLSPINVTEVTRGRARSLPFWRSDDSLSRKHKKWSSTELSLIHI